MRPGRGTAWRPYAGALLGRGDLLRPQAVQKGRIRDRREIAGGINSDRGYFLPTCEAICPIEAQIRAARGVWPPPRPRPPARGARRDGAGRGRPDGGGWAGSPEYPDTERRPAPTSGLTDYTEPALPCHFSGITGRDPRAVLLAAGGENSSKAIGLCELAARS